MSAAQPAMDFKAAARFWHTAECQEDVLFGVDTADLIGWVAPPGEPSGFDDFPEVAVADGLSKSIRIFINTGNWTGDPPAQGMVYSSNWPLPNNLEPYDVQFADMNGDMAEDLVVSTYFKNRRHPMEQPARAVSDLDRDPAGHRSEQPDRDVVGPHRRGPR